MQISIGSKITNIRNSSIFEIWETLIISFTVIAVLIQLLFQFKNPNGQAIFLFIGVFRKLLQGKTEKTCESLNH